MPAPTHYRSEQLRNRLPDASSLTASLFPLPFARRGRCGGVGASLSHPRRLNLKPPRGVFTAKRLKIDFWVLHGFNPSRWDGVALEKNHEAGGEDWGEGVERMRKIERSESARLCIVSFSK
ncbi:hypothetical protein AVEN_186802-1 [Araneus ventricosus]|uniref:Uncharacterized protein n=1 Tax=Araneus ventricosus TaxID=182803 RepID=A0A4Y2CI77_ARAVE|nr:hypothetical protein AVEN_174924-1 [Araneus ventricosus]GBM03458.1 hypothetical protein AVEN_186802-1 [Araneus ventricosus]